MKYIFFLCATLLAMHAYAMNTPTNLIIANRLSQRVRVTYEPRIKETTYTTFKKDEESITTYQAITLMHPESSTIIAVRKPTISLNIHNFMPITQLPIVQKGMIIIHPIENNQIKVTQNETILTTLTPYIKKQKTAFDKGYEGSGSDDGCCF